MEIGERAVALTTSGKFGYAGVVVGFSTAPWGPAVLIEPDDKDTFENPMEANSACVISSGMLADAYEWLGDVCDDVPVDISEEELVRNLGRWYDGGWWQFIKDTA